MILKQQWPDYVRYIITEDYGSVFVEIYNEPLSPIGEKAYIWALYVDENHRRKRIATHLLAQAEDILRNNGENTVFLKYSKKDTPKGILYWYMGQGYTTVSSNNEYVLLKKNLNETEENHYNNVVRL